uniref:RELT like 1 n=1 Tax=Capra hircus TaxID=9925 RepID=A0A8C2NLJ7_CAPHI
SRRPGVQAPATLPRPQAPTLTGQQLSGSGKGRARTRTGGWGWLCGRGHGLIRAAGAADLLEEEAEAKGRGWTRPRAALTAVLAAAVFVGGAVSSPLVPSDHSGSHPLPSKTETTPSPTNSAGNGHPEYIAYALVPVFFVMGLFGVLICHLLKKKGYRCTTEAEQDVEGEKVEKIELNDSVNENTDTVGQIVQYIMKNEANVDVLAAMVADNSVCDPERFRVTKVEPKSNQKERRSLMSVSGTDSVNGEVPVTPVKRQQSDAE